MSAVRYHYGYATTGKPTQEVGSTKTGGKSAKSSNRKGASSPKRKG